RPGPKCGAQYPAPRFGRTGIFAGPRRRGGIGDGRCLNLLSEFCKAEPSSGVCSDCESRILTLGVGQGKMAKPSSGVAVSETEVHHHFEVYSKLMPERSAAGLGYLSFIASSSSHRIWETARLRNHFRLAGITYQGACFLLHLRSISS